MSQAVKLFPKWKKADGSNDEWQLHADFYVTRSGKYLVLIGFLE